jgi:hypothetical protein
VHRLDDHRYDNVLGYKNEEWRKKSQQYIFNDEMLNASSIVD